MILGRSTTTLAWPLVLVCLIATADPSKVQAEPFSTSFVFTGQTGSEASVGVVSQPTGATFSALTRSADLSTVSGVNSLNSSHLAQSATLTDTTMSFLTFTITPATNESLSLGLIDFFVQRSGTGPISLDLRTSMDGYSASLFTSTIATPNQVTEERANTMLSGIMAPVTFHLYAFDSGGTAGTFRITDSQGASGTQGAAGLTVNGNLASVPEPGSIVSLISGTLLMGTYGLIRHRKASQVI